LVNLETHQPITLLKDRKAETLADWLREHPGVEVLSRDRSKTYKSAMDRAAPNAIQVADRFHLVKNLSEALELALEGYPSELKATAQIRDQTAIADSSETVIVTPKPTASANAQERTRANYQRRVEQQRSIKTLHEQQWPQAAIAQKLGVSIRTVQRYLARPDFPPTPSQQQAFGKSLLNPYRQKILDWWNSGIMQSNVLMLLLQREGYQGGLRTLQRYLSGLREAQGSPRVQPSHSLPNSLLNRAETRKSGTRGHRVVGIPG
jgi:transposase